MKANTLFVLVLLMALGVKATADDEAANRPIVQSSEYGTSYAKSVPDDSFGQRGKTRVFAVGKIRDTLIGEYDWYASEIYIGGTGAGTLVRFGPWQRGREPKRSDLALGIYRDGKMIREYSTLELQKLGSGVSTSVSHYGIFQRRLGFRWLTENSYVFEVESANGRIFSFDLDTGAVAVKDAEQGAPADAEKPRR